MKAADVGRDDELDDDADDLDRDDDDHVPVGRAHDTAPARSTVREGLPPSYRMRHEPHYVEALVAPPAPVAPPTAVSAPTPVDAEGIVPAPVSDARLAGAIGSLAASLAAIHASLRDVPLRGRPLRERVAIDLARAEAVRAGWVAEAAAALQSDPLPSLDQVDLAAVCRTVSEALASECRLAGGAPVVSLPAGAAPVFGDERLLTTAVGAAVAAMRSLVEDRGDASRIELALAPRLDTTSRAVEITQSAVRVPASAQARFFEASWTGHPAGATAAVLLAAARRIAEAHGGGLAVAEVAGGGCRLTLSVPAAG